MHLYTSLDRRMYQSSLVSDILNLCKVNKLSAWLAWLMHEINSFHRTTHNPRSSRKHQTHMDTHINNVTYSICYYAASLKPLQTTSPQRHQQDKSVQAVTSCGLSHAHALTTASPVHALCSTSRTVDMFPRTSHWQLHRWDPGRNTEWLKLEWSKRDTGSSS